MMIVTLTLRTDDSSAAQKAARTLSSTMVKLVSDGASDVDVRVNAYNDDEDEEDTTEDAAPEDTTATEEEPEEDDADDEVALP